MAAEIERRRKLLLNSLGHVRRFGPVRNPVEEDREFIATESRHDVGFANATFKTPRHGDQQLIANRVTETIVDVLESIEVKKQDGELVILLVLGALNDELQILSQQRAVRQIRQ